MTASSIKAGLPGRGEVQIFFQCLQKVTSCQSNFRFYFVLCFAGASGNHVFINCYSPEFESFSGEDSYQLDEWVFNKVEDFFQTARLNSTLTSRLKEDKVVFFLHLLGIDTNGHSHKPNSK